MNTKLFIRFFSVSILFLSNNIFSQYRHQASVNNPDDGAFNQNQNIINVGVGFISGLGGIMGSGYTSSVSPAFEFSFEHAMNYNIGSSAEFSYQSATTSMTTSQIVNIFNTSTMSYSNVTYYHIDTWKLSMMRICSRAAYHFTSGPRIDPYIGALIGFSVVNATETITDAYNGNSTQSANGISYDIGAFLGLRYYFSDHIGIWTELKYGFAPYSGVEFNPEPIANGGIVFKFQ